MMRQYTSLILDKHTEDNNKGIIIPLLAIVIVTSMLVVGLAVDSGYLFQADLLLRKSVDAAALAGAKRVAITGKAQQLAEADFISKVREEVVVPMLRRNLLVKKQDADLTSLQIEDVSIDLVQDTVSVSASLEVDLLILKYFPGYSQNRKITASAQAQVQRLMTSLILDSSYSMLCPADGGDCACAETITCNPPLKLDRLRAAVAEFANQFNTERDLLHIAYFSLGSVTAVNMYPSGGFSLGDVLNALRAMIVQGATNSCEGLLRGWIGTRQAVNAQRRSNIAYVLFTDGAPNAARFFFAHPTALPPSNGLGMPFSTYDYYSWAVDYLTIAQLIRPVAGEGIHGVMQLAQAAFVRWNWTIGEAPQPRFRTGDSRVPCSPRSEGNPRAAFEGCLADFAFFTPDQRVWGGGVPFENYRQQYYNCVIAMSDFLRDDRFVRPDGEISDEGGIVYTIGVGNPAPASSDAYQDANNSKRRKDYFLSRVANDPSSTTDGHPIFPYGFGAYNPPAGFRHLTQGEYLRADNSLTLNLLFLELYEKMARKIKNVQLVR